MELVIEHVKFKTKEEKERVDRIEQGVTTMYNHIPENAQEENTSVEEKLNLISKTIEHYR